MSNYYPPHHATASRVGKSHYPLKLLQRIVFLQTKLYKIFTKKFVIPLIIENCVYVFIALSITDTAFFPLFYN